MTYVEFAKGNIWVIGTRTWRPRIQMRNVLVRMQHVSPRNVEAWCLRELLKVRRGCVSYASVRTIVGLNQNQPFATFKLAAVALGLYEDDFLHNRYFDEAIHTTSARMLRRYFAIILHFQETASPVLLWLRFRQSFIEDYIHQGLDEVVASMMALQDIANYLHQHGRTLIEFNLNLFDFNPLININPLLEMNVERLIGTLNPGQLEIYNEVVERSLNPTRSNLFYVGGAGGTGKTYLYNVLATRFGQSALVVSSTGISATLLRGGTTAHSAFHIPLHVDETSMILLDIAERDFIKQNVKLIIWDEVTMSHRHALECVDRCMSAIFDLPNFGGLVMIFGGDFR